MNSKIKKVIGAVSLVGALLISEAQAADAATKSGNLIPIGSDRHQQESI